MRKWSEEDRYKVRSRGNNTCGRDRVKKIVNREHSMTT